MSGPPRFVRSLNAIARVLPALAPLLIRFQKRVYRGLGALDRYRAEIVQFYTPTGGRAPQLIIPADAVPLRRALLTYACLYPAEARGVLRDARVLWRDVATLCFLGRLESPLTRGDAAYFALRSVRDRHTGSGHVLYAKIGRLLADRPRELYFDNAERALLQAQTKMAVRAALQAIGVHGPPLKMLVDASHRLTASPKRVQDHLLQIRGPNDPLVLADIALLRDWVKVLCDAATAMQTEGLWAEYVSATAQLRDWLYEQHPSHSYREFHLVFAHVELAMVRHVLEQLNKPRLTPASASKTARDDSPSPNSKPLNSLSLHQRWELFETATEHILTQAFPAAASMIAPRLDRPRHLRRFVYEIDEIPADELPAWRSATMLGLIFTCPYTVFLGILDLGDVSFSMVNPSLSVSQTVSAAVLEKAAAAQSAAASAVSTAKSSVAAIKRTTETGAASEPLSDATSDSTPAVVANAVGSLQNIISSNEQARKLASGVFDASERVSATAADAARQLTEIGAKSAMSLIFDKIKTGARHGLRDFLWGYKQGLYQIQSADLMRTLRDGAGKTLAFVDSAKTYTVDLAERYQVKARAMQALDAARDRVEKLTSEPDPPPPPPTFDELRTSVLSDLSIFYSRWQASTAELRAARVETDAAPRKQRLRERIVPTNEEILEDHSMLAYHTQLVESVLAGRFDPAGTLLDDELLVHSLLGNVRTCGYLPRACVPKISLLQLASSSSARRQARETAQSTSLPALQDVLVKAALGQDYFDREAPPANVFDDIQDKLSAIASTSVDAAQRKLASAAQTAKTHTESAAKAATAAAESMGASRERLEAAVQGAKARASSLADELKSEATKEVH
ncbi:hypothetical protein CAOG_05180 [Capsaspora owczarzaki ATCC 30864]|uniref:Uncharacterized protein n=1 Tax=Capsaspora owczarzaki (strain ATCC 30864) TaxID=595528 RepID=A0A0D2WSS4_CAPO3|nr:hypothetical protein CAOG_05180 [Capsaspora owczarzaki ATCC 30864]KJE94548.1 hypothetical protein CAOG_005180 [Capsaspora owczarzaki ATCC 30864]|eukprot:XP_004346865.1 hypothetical protein CAOG_05180 [Capsaspora owczarzaki ATCC 30864]